MVQVLLVAAVNYLAFSHGRIRDGVDIDRFPINPKLGVSGFPDCVRRNPGATLSMDEAGMDLVCAAKPSAPEAVKIATIGDSITAGVRLVASCCALLRCAGQCVGVAHVLRQCLTSMSWSYLADPFAFRFTAPAGTTRTLLNCKSC